MKHYEYPELHNGDCLTQQAFHSVYERMPEGFQAELIGGIVFVREPVASTHAAGDMHLQAAFVHYQSDTSGIQAGANGTVILSDEDEVQPDAFMRILPSHGGQSGNSYHKHPYVTGAPELVAEVSLTSRAIDLHHKKLCYQKAGVVEYIVLCLEPLAIHWFDFSKLYEITADSEGIFRSSIFPGLWIHGEHLLNRDHKKLIAVMNRGLGSPEHAAFVERLCTNSQGK